MTDDIRLLPDPAEPPPAPRAGRRRRRGADVRPAAPEQPPVPFPRLPFDPVRAVSDDQLEAIHLASLRVLAETGIDFLHPEALRRWREVGADVAGERVRLDPELVLDLVSRAPARFTLHSRNPARHLDIGGDGVVFGTVASAPNVTDRAGGRRTGTRADFADLIRLSQWLNAIHFYSGYPVEPVDLDPAVRHLHATLDLLTLSDKPIHGYSLGADRNRDCLEMVRIARGIDDETLDAEPSIFSVINSSSPLRLDTPMLEGVLQLSSRNQVVVLTPFTLAGAMAPVTVAGALVQQNAEALAGVAFTQLVRAGSPVVYGGFTSNVDMQSGSPAFGTPEFMTSALVGGQLARRYGLPYRSSNVCTANTVDAQSGYESVFSLWGAIMGGANMVLHGAGWLEGGLQASFEKMVIDADLLQMVARFLQPLVVDDVTLAVEAIAEVGPGGHFFGIEHTRERFRDAFHRPMVSDWRNHESWAEAGRPTTFDHAEAAVARVLALYEEPPMAAEIRQELDDFVAKRVAEGGAATDY